MEFCSEDQCVSIVSVLHHSDTKSVIFIFFKAFLKQSGSAGRVWNDLRGSSDTEEPWESSTTLSVSLIVMHLCNCVSLNLRILWRASDLVVGGFHVFVEISVRFSGSCWGLTSVGQNLLSWKMLNFPRVPTVSHLFPPSFPCCLAWPHPSCSGGDFPECVLLGTLAVICDCELSVLAGVTEILFLSASSSVEPVLLDWNDPFLYEVK